MFERIYLDSNVIISAFSGEAERENASILLNMIGAVSETRIAPFVTSELTLAEVLVRPLRAGLDEAIGAMDNVLTSSGWMEVAEISRKVIFGAAWLRSQHAGVKLPDAIHVATALATGCSHLLTADTGLSGAFQLEHWRAGETARSTSVEVIRPDIATLALVTQWLTA